MLEQAVGVLYTVTVALKGPVVLGVLVALAWSLFESGALVREWLQRRRSPGDLVRQVRQGVNAIGAPAPPTDLLVEVELEAARRLSRMRLGLRVGPVLGLMGTLIPMGPALKSIAEGNLTAMSNDLIIAFSTTVVGLLVGMLCYVMLVARQNWYARDMADLERLTQVAPERSKP